MPKYVVTSGKFLNSYATIWNGDPKYLVQSEGNIGADSITPSVGTYKKKVGNGKVVFSAPEEADGYKCRGYMLETTYTDWEEAEKITVEDVNSFELEIDSAKTYRITWLWKGNSDCSVSVGSNRGVDFGACSPAYGMYTEFEGDTKTFTASEPTYDETLGYRYEVTGWKLSKADGSVESGTGTEFVYDKSMGNVSLEWQWSVTGYRIVCQADGYLPVTTDPAADSKGYFTAGSEVSLTAVDGDLGEFYHWAGKTAKLDSFSRTVSVTLNEPITLVATPKYTWYYTGSMLTNCVGWKVGATLISKTSNLSLNGDCVSAGARLPWSTDRYAANSVHLLDLSQPIVSTTGAPLYITKNSNYSFRRMSGPFLAKLILPDTWKETAALSNAAALFDGQSCLSEIMPAPFPKDFSGPAGTAPYFGEIPYSGDIYLLAECFTAFGSNCGVRFSHKKTQNLYLGKQFASLGQNTFANGTGRYVCWFYGYPTSIASSRSAISDYSLYVRYPSANTSWNAYLAKHARDFAESDKTGFSKTFPEAAAAGEWPKHTFTNGYFKGTWARVWGPANGSVIVIK